MKTNALIRPFHCNSVSEVLITAYSNDYYWSANRQNYSNKQSQCQLNMLHLFTDGGPHIKDELWHNGTTETT